MWVERVQTISQCELGQFKIRANSVMFLKDTLPDFNNALTDPCVVGLLTKLAHDPGPPKVPGSLYVKGFW